jgi:2-oxoisovalerate ferredoxin oxidoreductase alpha subunit
MYGAAGAGKLCMTATSGPGFSLMQEGLSYMGGAELPGVFVDVMRCGPGLGNVYPEQGDYNQAVKGGGHGNYKCIVLAPASVQEMCDLTMKAFELTVKYRTPAIVLVDGLQGQMMEPLVLPEKEWPAPDMSAWAAEGTAATRKNLVKSICVDGPAQEQLNLRLQRKYESMAPEAMYETYLCDDADLVIVAYGISSRIGRTTAEKLRAAGYKVGVFRPKTLQPFPREALCRTVKGRKVMVMELSAGQFRDDILIHLAKGGGDANHVELCNRMGGVVITVDDAVAQVKEILK